MKLTEEQQLINDTIISNEGLFLVDSVSGSGKTMLLTAIATSISHTNGLYLAYNKSVATTAQRKFPRTTHCMTTHSLAYQATVKPFKLNLGTFNYRSINEHISYDDKYTLTQHIKAFCLSKYTNFDDYAEAISLTLLQFKLAKKYLDLMQSGKIECTHDFYLKYFHILLSNKTLSYEPFDFIMLDEAGDLNEVTLAIFLLLPSTRKIAVGDKFQNIYQFNHTINCFNALYDQGTLLKMTQSFRVPKAIAKQVECFGRKYLDPTLDFKGINIRDPVINTRAYLTRTNAAMIKKMIQLNQKQIPYGLVRRASEIFKVPLMLCSIKYKGLIKDPTYKHLQTNINEWYETESLQERFKTPLSYLAFVYEEDIALIQAIRLIQQYKVAPIMEAYNEARKHEQTTQTYTLATVHSTKGLEFDEVTIADDLNKSTQKAIDHINSSSLDKTSLKDTETLNLYYVAVTRAAKELYNAKHL